MGLGKHLWLQAVAWWMMRWMNGDNAQRCTKPNPPPPLKTPGPPSPSELRLSTQLVCVRGGAVAVVIGVVAFHLPSVSFARSGPRRSAFPVIKYSTGKFRAMWWKFVGTNFSEIWVDVKDYPLVEINSSSVINPSSSVCRIIQVCL